MTSARKPFLFVLLLLLPFGLRAQAQSDPVPDTQDWRQYFPLEVGNQWQYQSEEFGSVSYMRWFVLSDTLIDNTFYYNLRVSSYDGERQLGGINTWQVRYDTAHANVVVRSQTVDGTFIDDWFQEIPCGLNASFGGRHACTGTRTEMEYFVDGDSNVSYVIWPDTVHTPVRKYFSSLGGDMILLSDIGLVWSVIEGGSPITKLVYADVDGHKYGEAAIPTGTEHVSESPNQLAITAVYPNPFNETSIVTYHVLVPGRMALRVYNLLGQCVRAHSEVAASPGAYRFTLDSTGLSAGTYFIRLLSDSGGSETRTVTLIK